MKQRCLAFLICIFSSLSFLVAHDTQDINWASNAITKMRPNFQDAKALSCVKDCLAAVKSSTLRDAHPIYQLSAALVMTQDEALLALSDAILLSGYNLDSSLISLIGYRWDAKAKTNFANARIVESRFHMELAKGESTTTVPFTKPEIWQDWKKAREPIEKASTNVLAIYWTFLFQDETNETLLGLKKQILGDPIQVVTPKTPEPVTQPEPTRANPPVVKTLHDTGGPECAIPAAERAAIIMCVREIFNTVSPGKLAAMTDDRARVAALRSALANLRTMPTTTIPPQFQKAVESQITSTEKQRDETVEHIIQSIMDEIAKTLNITAWEGFFKLTNKEKVARIASQIEQVKRLQTDPELSDIQRTEIHNKIEAVETRQNYFSQWAVVDELVESTTDANKKSNKDKVTTFRAALSTLTQQKKHTAFGEDDRTAIDAHIQAIQAKHDNIVKSVLANAVVSINQLTGKINQLKRDKTDQDIALLDRSSSSDILLKKIEELKIRASEKYYGKDSEKSIIEGQINDGLKKIGKLKKDIEGIMEESLINAISDLIDAMQIPLIKEAKKGWSCTML